MRRCREAGDLWGRLEALEPMRRALMEQAA